MGANVRRPPPPVTTSKSNAYGVDVEAYLTVLLTHLPDHSVRRLGDWLPRAWQQRDRAAQQAAGALGLTA